MDPSRFSLHAAPGHLVRRAQQVHLQLFDQFVGQSDLTSPQFAIIVAVHQNPGIDQITLSGLAGIDRSTLADILRRLETRNLISRAQDPRDSRRRLVTLTTIGTRAACEWVDAVDKVGQALLAPLEVEEKEIFVRLLTKVVSHYDATFPTSRREPSDLRRSRP